MIQLAFLIGFGTGIFVCTVLFFIIFYEDIKAVREFNDRQEKYRKMI